MRIIAFDDNRSYFHFLMGFIAPIWPRLGLIILLLFLFYEGMERERIQNKRGDLIEFLAGAGGCAILSMIARLF